MHGTCDKCKSKKNYNFVINNGLCDPCIEARLAELKGVVRNIGNLCSNCNNLSDAQAIAYGSGVAKKDGCDQCWIDKLQTHITELEDDNRHRACLELDALGKIAGLEAEIVKHQWISVEDRLPEDENQVWIWYKGTVYTYVAYYDFEYKIWHMFNYGGIGYIMADEAPTHWKPITLPEKE